MTKPQMTPPPGSQPLHIVVTRGDSIESRHLVHAVAVDTRGRVVAAWGDPQLQFFPRSALKPLQALPLVMSGAAQRYSLDARHLALASASHNGEPVHVALVKEWLQRLGLTAADLECGATMPIDPNAASAASEGPRSEFNNCSGKHCGFLTSACHTGYPVAGYIGHQHPVQLEVRQTLEQILGRSLTDSAWGTDGCGIPNHVLSLGEFAAAMARFADPVDLQPPLRSACQEVAAAMLEHPYLVAGAHRFDTDAMLALPGRVIVKSGAEGVCAALIPERGLAVVTKVLDGARRASDVAMATALRALGVLDGSNWKALAPYCEPAVHNVAGKIVGCIRLADAGGKEN